MGAVVERKDLVVVAVLEVVATGQTKEMDPAAPSTQAVEAAGEVNTTTRQQAVTAVRESSRIEATCGLTGSGRWRKPRHVSSTRLADRSISSQGWGASASRP